MPPRRKTMIIFIISLIIYIIGVTADIITTRANNDGIGGMYEKNPRYRLPNGDANMKKLIRDKIFLGMMCLGVCVVVLQFHLDFTPFSEGIIFILLAVVGLKHLQVAYQNRKVAEKFAKNR